MVQSPHLSAAELTTRETNRLAGLRVAVISQGLGGIEPPRAQGSIATWTFETARHLAKRCQLLLVEFGNLPWRSRTATYEGATYHYVPAFLNRMWNAVHRRLVASLSALQSKERALRRPEYASIFHNLGYVVQAAWTARRQRCQLIHIHNFSQFVPVVRALNRTAFIVLHMNCEWLSQHDPRMIRRRLRHADAIVCCSGHIRDRFLEVFPERREQTHIVYNGSNVERFAAAADPGRETTGAPLRIVFVGRISPEKGVHILVDAFTRLAPAYASLTLEIVGGAGSLPKEYLVGLSRDPHVKKLEQFYEGNYMDEVQRRIPADLRHRVLFHGNVGHDKLAELLRGAAMLAIPSYSDAFPLTVVEAMAAGLPVVGSAIGGIKESVLHEQTGLLVQPDDADALATAFRRLLDDEDLRFRMGAAGRERALRLFSWRAIADQVAQVYALAAEKNPTL